MDGLPGLEKVFKPNKIGTKAKVQRCQVHMARNVLAKVPRKLKKVVANELQSIFYVSSKKKAMEFFDQFKVRWEKYIPSAINYLENSLEAYLTYLNYPEEQRISLRTTNIIERLNKEFKRRTTPLEIVVPPSGTILSWLLSA